MRNVTNRLDRARPTGPVRARMVPLLLSMVLLGMTGCASAGSTQSNGVHAFNLTVQPGSIINVLFEVASGRVPLAL